MVNVFFLRFAAGLVNVQTRIRNLDNNNKEMIFIASLCAVTTVAVPVLVGLAPANTSRSLPLLGFGTELVWQNVNDSGLLAAASVTAGGAVARYPGGTPSNYWDWSCRHNESCCTEVSLARGQIGKCKGPLGQQAVGPAAWSTFVQQPSARATVFGLSVRCLLCMHTTVLQRVQRVMFACLLLPQPCSVRTHASPPHHRLERCANECELSVGRPASFRGSGSARAVYRAGQRAL